jgi:hypothetical protein
MLKRVLPMCLLLLVITSACGKTESGPVTAVERYYLAIIQQNPADLSSIVCASFEEQARTELDSFQGVKTELKDFQCSENGTEGEATLVKCTGEIQATYGNEKMDFPLDSRVHKVENQKGDWLVCGY